MKLLIVAFVFLIGVVLAIPPWLKTSATDDDREAYLEYKQKYNKSAKCQEHRFRIFMDNRKKVEEHQEKFKKGEVSWEMSCDNEFCDQDPKEFVKTHCGARDDKELNLTLPTMPECPSARQSNPAYWDVRVNGPGRVLAIKNQGQCGSCWAFAVTAAIENLLSQTQWVEPLSEQQIVDCDYSNYGCGGGWCSQAFEYTKSRGLATSNSYPYYERDDYCYEDWTWRPYRHWSYVRLPNNIESIKTHIRTRGVCTVYVDSRNWQFYSGGIFNGAGWSPVINHAVNLIGWGPGYWLVRNSWGTWWGESGYIKVSMQSTGGLFTEYVYCPTNY